VVLAIIIAAIIVLVAKGPAIAQRIKDEALPRISAQMGRKVDVARVHFSLLPSPGVRLDQVRVAGVEGGPDLLDAKSVTVTVHLLKLIVSRGRDVQFHSIKLRDFDVNLVRSPAGTWNYEGLVGEGGGGGPQVSVSRLSLADGLIRVIDRAAAGAEGTSVALSRIRGTVSGLGSGSRLLAHIEAALASASPNLSVDLSTPSAQAGLSGLTGTIELKKAQLAQLKGLMSPSLASSLTGGSLTFSSKVTSQAGGQIRAEGSAQAEELSLRGHPASGSVAYIAEIDPASRAIQVRGDHLELKGPGLDLGGSAQLWGMPLQIQFQLQGSTLDLGTLLAALPPQQSPPSSSGPLPPSMQRRSSPSISGTLAVAKVIDGRLEANDVSASAELVGGKLSVRTARARLYGGELKADGSQVDLSGAVPAWNLKANLRGMDLGAALRQLTGSDPLQGRLAAKTDLVGHGDTWSTLRQDLSGNGEMDLSEGIWTRINLAEELAAPILQVLHLSGQNVGGAGGSGEQKTTRLDKVHATFRVNNGMLNLTQPISMNSDFGEANLRGAIGLDGRLDLQGTAGLVPDFLAGITSGKLRLGAPVQVPFGIGGTLEAPAVRPPSPETVGRALVPHLLRSVPGAIPGLRNIIPGGGGP
jgi:AsmA protein